MSNQQESDGIEIGYTKTARGLNLREQPDLMSKSLKILKDKEELLIEGEKDGWYKVVTGSGLEGYCLKEFVVKD